MRNTKQSNKTCARLLMFCHGNLLLILNHHNILHYGLVLWLQTTCSTISALTAVTMLSSYYSGAAVAAAAAAVLLSVWC
jgi:hypothetical protein